MIFSLFFIDAPIFVMGRFFNTSTERVCGHFKSVDWVKSPSKSVKVIENGDFRGFDSFPAGRMDDKK
jgi:hypothetical protein